MTTKTTRVDDLGRAYAGSQLQTQLYVNRRSEELSQKVTKGLLENDKFPEYQDTAFLKACGLKHFSAELKAFWPRSGPVWNDLGSIERVVQLGIS